MKGQDANNYEYNDIGQLVKNEQDKLEYIYNASGLVTEIQKDGKPQVKFYYDDRGHRIRKESNFTGAYTGVTYYVRDVSGNPMSIVTPVIGKTTEKPTIEHPIYGASRLGIYNKKGDASVYQLTDHLGNVRAVAGKDAQGNVIAKSATDYYPFGMPMPGRQMVNGEPYRYAYQGQEKDPETRKEAFQLRLWDGRIGRWLTTDPKGEFSSPYLGMGNNPMNKIDPDGGSTSKPQDRWKLGEDGRLVFVDHKGGDKVDYLIVGEKEIKVTDTSILPSLENNIIREPTITNKKSYHTGHYAISDNHKEVKKLFQEIASYDSNEWAYIKAKTEFGIKSFIGTLHTSDQAPTPSRSQFFGNYTTIIDIHSHHGKALYDFRASGNDIAAANKERLTNPKAKFYVFSPLLTKNNYNKAIKSKRGTGYKRGYKPINHEPNKYIKY